jgi:predicted acylesterase/phospholipase RssA
MNNYDNILDDDTLPENNNENTIKHLVISGGASYGFLSYYGILKESNKQGLWKVDNIKSIYGTSAGTMLAVLISLKYNWDVLDNYLIKRPWYRIFKFDFDSLYKSILNKGILNKSVIYDAFSPIFKAMDISLDITLLEFYQKTNIEIFMFSTELETLNYVNLSYKTHPNWKVLDAVYASSCVPVIFVPLEIETKNNCKQTYIDGYICLNYPLSICLNDGNSPSEIFGIKPFVRKELQVHSNMDSFSNSLFSLFSNSLFSYLCDIFMNLLIKCKVNYPEILIKYEIHVPLNVDVSIMIRLADSIELRSKVIEEGIIIMKKWIVQKSFLDEIKRQEKEREREIL